MNKHVLLAFWIGVTLASTHCDGAEEKPVGTWVRGTVRDESGKPLEGVKVYAAGIFHGGMRMYETAASGVTDSEGRYEISGSQTLANMSATLVAEKPGMVPAISWFDYLSRKFANAPETQVSVRDLVMTTRGGQLVVAVSENDKPAAGVHVTLERAGGHLRDQWARDTNTEAQEGALRVAFPATVTDDQGMAHFDHLIPGKYEVVMSRTASETRKTFRPPERWHEHDGILNFAVGVDVRAGEKSVQTMSVYQPVSVVRYLCRHADGRPTKTKECQLRFGAVNHAGAFTSSGDDDGGMHTLRSFGLTGLVEIELKKSKTPGGVSSSLSDQKDPYEAAPGIVAVSKLLKVQKLPEFTMRTRDPGVVNFQVTGVDGKPIETQVSYTQQGILNQGTTRTDAAGRGQFTGLIPGVYELHAGNTAEPFVLSANLPEVAKLVGQSYFPTTQFVAQIDERLDLNIQCVPASFITGKLTPSPNHKLSEYAIYASRYSQTTLNAQTGEYVIGPVGAGDVSIRVTDRLLTYKTISTTTVRVDRGKIAEVEIKVPEELGDKANEATVPSVSVGIGGLTQRMPVDSTLTGVVVRSDGKTPAAFARIFVVNSAESPVPGAEGLTDPLGRIHFRSRVTSYPLPNSREKTLVALLPGECGAAILKVSAAMPRPVTLQLPNPISARGRVTIGGKSPQGLPAQVRVLAAYQDLGKLNDLFSVLTTPQDDGSFTLRGLTPGQYLVQAAVDGIWLSKSIPLHVTDRERDDLLLEIPRPGGPVEVTLVSHDGTPVRSEKLTIDRPPGPFTDIYWPKQFMSDGAGVVSIPALEEGRHILRVAGKTIEVTAPPAITDSPTKVNFLVETPMNVP